MAEKAAQRRRGTRTLQPAYPVGVNLPKRKCRRREHVSRSVSGGSDPQWIPRVFHLVEGNAVAAVFIVFLRHHDGVVRVLPYWTPVPRQ